MRLVALLAALSLAAPAAAAPLAVRQIIALAEAGLSEDAIVSLVEAEGLETPIGAEEALELRDGGVPAPLVSRLVEWSAGSGISVDERDGVLVVSGSGVPDAESELDAEAEPAPELDEPRLEDVVSWGIGPEAAAVEAPDEAPDEAGLGYPVGAAFGWGGGAVFLPARFGGSRPSAFGRTLVSFGPSVAAPLVPAPWPAPCASPAPVAPFVGPGGLVLAQPATRFTSFRTSRGELWVPY